MVEFRPPTLADADDLAPRLRAADQAELQATHGAHADPRQILRLALRVTPDALAAVEHGRPIALLGCAPVGTLLNPRGSPWLLGSDECARHARVFLDAGRREVAAWEARHGMLENWVDARHAASIRWLRRLGFVIWPAAPRGAQGLPFHRFTRCT